MDRASMVALMAFPNYNKGLSCLLVILTVPTGVAHETEPWWTLVVLCRRTDHEAHIGRHSSHRTKGNCFQRLFPSTMSLVDSIFGSKSDDKASATLFEAAVPEPTLHTYPESRRKRTSDGRDEGADPSKKQKKSGSDGEEDAGTSKEAKKQSEEETKDEEERTVFVGNLPVSTTRKTLARLFKDCGAITSTRIRSVAVEGVKLPPERAGDQNLVKKVCANTKLINADAKSSVLGYVVFADKESVERALQLNNTEIGDPSSKQKRRMRVDTAKPSTDAGRSVFVGNLPYGANEDSLQEHFCHGCDLTINDVEGVRVVRDPSTFQCRGFGYVLFRDRSIVAEALRRMHGSTYMGRELRVQVCGKRTKGRRGEAAPAKKEQPPSVGALKRLLTKQATESPKKRRARAEKKPKARKAGVSKRAALEAKTEKRVKKIQKRITKGMGKARAR